MTMMRTSEKVIKAIFALCVIYRHLPDFIHFRTGPEEEDGENQSMRLVCFFAVIHDFRFACYQRP